MRKRRNPIDRRNLTEKASYSDNTLRVVILPYEYVKVPTMSEQKYASLEPMKQKEFQRRQNDWLEYKNNELRSPDLAYFVQENFESLRKPLNESIYKLRVANVSDPSLQSLVSFLYDPTTNSVLVAIPMFSRRGIWGTPYEYKYFESIATREKVQEMMLDQTKNKTKLDALLSYESFGIFLGITLDPKLLEFLNSVNLNPSARVYELPLYLYDDNQQKWIADVFAKTQYNQKLLFDTETLTYITRDYLVGKPTSAPPTYKEKLQKQLQQMDTTNAEYRQRYDLSVIINPFLLSDVGILSYIVQPNQDTEAQLRQVLDSHSPSAGKNLISEYPGYLNLLMSINELNNYPTVEEAQKSMFRTDTGGVTYFPWMQDFYNPQTRQWEQGFLQYSKDKRGYRITQGKFFSNGGQYKILGPNTSGFQLNETITDETYDKEYAIINFKVISIPITNADGGIVSVNVPLIGPRKQYANLVICGVAGCIIAMYYMPQEIALLANRNIIPDEKYQDLYCKPIELLKEFYKSVGKSDMTCYMQSQDVDRAYNPQKLYDCIKSADFIEMYELPFKEEDKYSRPNLESTFMDRVKPIANIGNAPVIASKLALKMGLVYKSPLSSGGIFILERPFDYELGQLLVGSTEDVTGELLALKQEFNIEQKSRFASKKKPVFVCYPLKPMNTFEVVVEDFNLIPEISYSPYITASTLATINPSFKARLLNYLSEEQDDDTYLYTTITRSSISDITDGYANNNENVTRVFKFENSPINVIPVAWKSENNSFESFSFKNSLRDAFSSPIVGFIVIDTLDCSITQSDMAVIINDGDDTYGNKTIKTWADEGYVIIFTGGGNYNAKGESSLQRELILWQNETDDSPGEGVFYPTPILASQNKTAQRGETDAFYKNAIATQTKQALDVFGSVEAIGTQAKPYEAEKKKVLGAMIWFSSIKRSSLIYCAGYNNADPRNPKYYVPTIDEMSAEGLQVDGDVNVYKFDNPEENLPIIRWNLQDAPTVAQFRSKVQALLSNSTIMKRLGHGLIDTDSNPYLENLEALDSYPLPRTLSQRNAFVADVKSNLKAVVNAIRNYIRNYSIANMGTGSSYVGTLSAAAQQYLDNAFTLFESGINKKVPNFERLFQEDLRDDEIKYLYNALGQVANILEQEQYRIWMNAFSLWQDIRTNSPKSDSEINLAFAQLNDAAKKQWSENRVMALVIAKLFSKYQEVLNNKLVARPRRVFVVGSAYPESQKQAVLDALSSTLTTIRRDPAPLLFVLDTTGASAIIEESLKNQYKIKKIPYAKGTVDVTTKIIEYVRNIIDPTDVVIIQGDQPLPKSTQAILKQLSPTTKQHFAQLLIGQGQPYSQPNEDLIPIEQQTIFPKVYLINENLEAVKLNLLTEAKNTVIPWQDYKDPYDDFWIEVQARFQLSSLPLMLHESSKSLRSFGAPSFSKRDTESEGEAEARFRQEWAGKAGNELKRQLLASLSDDKTISVPAENYLKRTYSARITKRSFINQEKNALNEAMRRVKKVQYRAAGGFIKQTDVGLRWVVPIKLINQVIFMTPAEYNIKRNRQPLQKVDGKLDTSLLREIYEALSPNYSQFQALDYITGLPYDVAKQTKRYIDGVAEKKREDVEKLKRRILSGTIDAGGFENAQKYIYNFAQHNYFKKDKKSLDKLVTLIVSLDRLAALPRKNATILRTPLFSTEKMSLGRETSLTLLEAATMFALLMGYLSSLVAGQQPIEASSFNLNAAASSDARRFRKALQTSIRPYLIKYTRVLAVLHYYALGQIPTKKMDIIQNSLLKSMQVDIDEDKDQVSIGLKQLVTESPNLTSRQKRELTRYIQASKYSNAVNFLVNETYGGDVPKTIRLFLEWKMYYDKKKEYESEYDVPWQLDNALQRIQMDLGFASDEEVVQYLTQNKSTLIADTMDTPRLSLYNLMSPTVTQNATTKKNTYIYDIHKFADYGIRVLIYVYNNMNLPKDHLPIPAFGELGGLTTKEFDAIADALKDAITTL